MVMGLSGLAVALLRTDHVLGWHLGIGRPLLWAVLGIGFLEENRPIATALWWIGTPIHLLFSIKIMHMWFFEDLQIQSLNPA